MKFTKKQKTTTLKKSNKKRKGKISSGFTFHILFHKTKRKKKTLTTKAKEPHTIYNKIQQEVQCSTFDQRLPPQKRLKLTHHLLHLKTKEKTEQKHSIFQFPFYCLHTHTRVLQE